MPSLPRSPGIYKITCVHNGKIYIGSSVNIKKRWQNHRSDLRKGSHHSIHLQRAWNKYGESAFTFEIIELVMPWSLIDREQYWLNKLKPYDFQIGFNTSKTADAPSGGRTPSLEQRAAISARNTELWKDPDYRARQKVSRTGNERTPEHCAAISAGQKGKYVSIETRKKQSDSHKGQKLRPESVQKRSETNRKYYIVTSPEGIETLVKGLDLFCKEHGLRQSTMYGLASGKTKAKTCKGWRCRYA